MKFVKIQAEKKKIKMEILIYEKYKDKLDILLESLNNIPKK